MIKDILKIVIFLFIINRHPTNKCIFIACTGLPFERRFDFDNSFFFLKWGHSDSLLIIYSKSKTRKAKFVSKMAILGRSLIIQLFLYSNWKSTNSIACIFLNFHNIRLVVLCNFLYVLLDKTVWLSNQIIRKIFFLTYEQVQLNNI